MSKIVIGSRGSDLALWQAHHVKSQLIGLGHEVELKIIKTQGDQIQDLSFDKLEGKGFFTKEIEDALINKDIDLAVHSHKDLETDPPEGLVIGAVSDRANPEDLLLINLNALDNDSPFSLKRGAKVGTSSARRKSQMLALRSDVEISDLRGNVPTRIQKLRDGAYDAILLARAGIERLELDLSDLKVVVMDPQEFVPAPAQGVLALQIRSADHTLTQILSELNNEDVAKRIQLERKILNLMDGGCQLPLGVYCNTDDELYVSYQSNAGSRILKKYNAKIIKPELVVEELLKDS